MVHHEEKTHHGAHRDPRGKCSKSILRDLSDLCSKNFGQNRSPSHPFFPLPTPRGEGRGGIGVRGHFHALGCPSADGHERLR